MTITESPEACRNPASSAASLPKLRLNETYRTRASSSASRFRTASVRSRLPSSTYTNSMSWPSGSSSSAAFWISSWKRATTASSL